MKEVSLFLFVIVVMLLCSSVCGIKKTKEISVTQKYSYVDSFGFLEGGTISIDFNVNPELSEIFIIICTDNEWNKLFKWSSGDPCISDVFKEGICTFVGITSNGGFHGNWTVDKNVVLNLGLVNCQTSYFSGELSYVFLNPGGENLGSGEIPLPMLYNVIAALWLVLNVVWCYNWIANRSQKSWLHRVISLYPLSKMLDTILSAVYWRVLSKVGSVEITILIFYYLFFIIFKSVFYLVLLLIASGWGICRDHLGRMKYFVFPSVLIVTASLMLAHFINSLFIILTLVMYITITVMIFTYILHNLQDLSLEIEHYGEGGANNRPNETQEPSGLQRTSALEKFNMFRSFRIIMMTYVVLMFAQNMIEFFFLYNHYWISYLLLEVLEFSMFACIGYTFRLRGENIYYRLYDENPGTAEQEMTSIQSTQQDNQQSEQN